MVWKQYYSQWRPRELINNLLGNNSRRSLSTGSDDPSRRSNRDNRHYRNNRTNLYYYLAVCLLAVSPAYAEEAVPEVHNTSSPVAAATGNVTNQAIQFQNSGAPSRQFFKGGNSCNGITMVASPFYTGGDVHTDVYNRTSTFGMSLNFSVPLDGGMVEQCKAIAKRHEQKMRLDYELVRALKCGELMQKGFMFRPGSRFEPLCSDVIAIAAYEKESNRDTIQRTTQPSDE